MNKPKKDILIFITLVTVGYFIFQTIQLKKQISETEIPKIDSRCVDKNSLNCSDIPELTYECSDDYQKWAEDNCPDWKTNNAEFTSGWYWGTLDQKKPNTPPNWIYQEAGRSSCWHAPDTECGFMPE